MIYVLVDINNGTLLEKIMICLSIDFNEDTLHKFDNDTYTNQ